MMEALAHRGIQSSLVDFYQTHIGFDLHGERLGCAFSDAESGPLTLNVGLIRTEADRIVLSLDIRNPDTFTPVSKTHHRAHETRHDLVCPLLH